MPTSCSPTSDRATAPCSTATRLLMSGGRGRSRRGGLGGWVVAIVRVIISKQRRSICRGRRQLWSEWPNHVPCRCQRGRLLSAVCRRSGRRSRRRAPGGQTRSPRTSSGPPGSGSVVRACLRVVGSCRNWSTTHWNPVSHSYGSRRRLLTDIRLISIRMSIPLVRRSKRGGTCDPTWQCRSTFGYSPRAKSPAIRELWIYATGDSPCTWRIRCVHAVEGIALTRVQS